jgi:hypothetical protein
VQAGLGLHQIHGRTIQGHQLTHPRPAGVQQFQYGGVTQLQCIVAVCVCDQCRDLVGPQHLRQPPIHLGRIQHGRRVDHHQLSALRPCEEGSQRGPLPTDRGPSQPVAPALSDEPSQNLQRHLVGIDRKLCAPARQLGDITSVSVDRMRAQATFSGQMMNEVRHSG